MTDSDHIAKVGATGQITIPLVLREYLDIQKGDYIVLTVAKDGNIQIQKAKIQLNKINKKRK